ncbi:Cytochrome oxidase assembly protein ShyY1 [Agromyces sp. CF514]|uniref:SURF1 family cytochrome oxidase biogenesis protein n=1 Tax=Agromyces sp. CF514 TaxID=1881031 RepID=UPI0008F28F7F|nr:SURF1 family cytochrome oxidase biogenesis protein [Agromyces sp. CF514]SFR85414.1 Cytochrome oxidase assembly protein ShyY1 [Agromyces sp. CF514]
MLQMMLRPRWVLALLFALAVAAAFALLGQWQIERAVEQSTTVDRPTEDVLPLGDLVQPDTATEQVATAQRVEVRGIYVPGDTVLVEGRLNDGVAGYWVVAHLEVTDAAPGGLPVALGWAADRDRAQAAADAFEADVVAGGGVEAHVVGRFLPSEAPVAPDEDGDPFAMTTVAVAQLINVWADYDDRPVYFGYVTATDAAPGLEVIASPAPEQTFELNWLNVFYAVEWAVFAGFAVYLWYRLVRDAVEREEQEAEEAAQAAAGAEEPAAH